MKRTDFHPLADANRKVLHDAGVFTVHVVGPSGSGKSMLIEAALKRLPQFHTAVIYNTPSPSCVDVPLPASPSERHIPIVGASIHAGDVRDVLPKVDLATLDLLIIESTTSTASPASEDLGEDLRLGVLSVVAGDDKARQHTQLVCTCDALVLTKTDLLPHVRFDLERFRADVRRLNPEAELLYVSSLREKEVDRWVDWLGKTAEKAWTSWTCWTTCQGGCADDAPSPPEMFVG